MRLLGQACPCRSSSSSPRRAAAVCRAVEAASSWALSSFRTLLGSAAAYSLARYPFRGSGVIYYLILAGLTFPVFLAIVPLFFGLAPLTSNFWEWEIPGIGHMEFVTSTIFDVGVYLVVIGLVLDVLRSLGAEVDRQTQAQRERVTA